MVLDASAHRSTIFRLDRRSTPTASFSAGLPPRRQNLRMGVVAALAVYALMPPVLVTAQEARISTTVASLGSGTLASRISLDAVRPKPATHRGLALPAFALIDDGGGPRVTSLVMELPVLDLENFSIASRLGNQSLPAVFRATPLAGSALTSPIRGLTLTTLGVAPLSLSFGQMGTALGPGTPGGPPAVAAAAMSFTPNARLTLTPRVLIDSGSHDAQTSVGTAIRANVMGNLALVSDVGMAGTTDMAWAPLASARLVGHWPRAGIETSVLRGAAAPEAGNAFVSSRDREAVQAHVQPLTGLTLAAITSLSRPAADPDADGTTLGSFRLAYDGLPTGQLAAVRQRETRASREADITSLEWRQRSLGRMAVRYVHHRASDSALDGVDEDSSRVEVDFPALAPRSAGLDLRAALTAGSGSQTDGGVNSRVSCRLGLHDEAALTGETELGLAGGNGHVLRALRVTTDMPVIPATWLQLSYTYLAGAQFPLGQVFEARISRRLRVGW
jgi:hypothetical protein